MTRHPTTTALTDANLRSSPVTPDSIPEVCRDVPFMSSLEIAERAGMRHGDVMRLIRRELEAIEIPERKFASWYSDVRGRRRALYCLPGEYLLHVLTAFDAKLRFALIKHWQAVNEGWVQPQKNAVHVLTERLVNGGRKTRMLELQQAEERAMLSGRRLTAKERNLILLP